jgi:hypothetical protein
MIGPYPTLMKGADRCLLQQPVPVRDQVQSNDLNPPRTALHTLLAASADSQSTTHKVIASHVWRQGKR